MRTAGCALLVAVLSAACETGGQEDQPANSFYRYWPPGEVTRVEPLANEIDWTGLGDSIPLYRVEQGHIVSDSVVLIANSGNNEIIKYNLSGGAVHRGGRAGRGPGDIERMSGLAVDDQGVTWVYDGATRTVTEFAPDLRAIRRWPKPPQAGSRFIGVARTEAYFMRGGSMNIFEPTGHPRRKYYAVERDGAIREFDGDSVPVGFVARFVFNQHQATSRRLSGADNPVVFERAAPEGIVLVDGQAGVVTLSDPAGSSVDTIARYIHRQRPQARGALKERFKATYLEGFTSRVDGPPTELVDAAANYWADHLWTGFWSDAVVEDVENIWVRHMHSSDETVYTWTRLSNSNEGVTVLQFALPRSYQVLDIRGGQLLAVTRDSFGVERLFLFDLG